MSRTLGLLSVSLLVLLAGCGGPKAPAPIPTPIVKTPVPTPAPAAAASSVAPSTPAKAVPPAANTNAANGAAADPALTALSRDELGQRMAAGQQRGFQQVQQGNAAEAYKSFQESAKYARELRRQFPQLSPQEQAAVGGAIYNDACALSMSGDANAAFLALQEAFAAGFADTNQLDIDSDLVAVRAMPEFAAWRKGLDEAAVARDAAAIAHVKEEVRNEMASFQSYPFDFTLPDLDDKTVKLADLKGKVVVVDFWGTWCPPCRAEIPSFVRLQTKYEKQGLQIIGLGYENGGKEEAVKLTRDFMANNKMNYTCMLGDAATQKQVPQFQGYPTTLFIDRTGKVRLQYVGLHPYPTLDAAVSLLLDEPAK